MKGRRRSGSGPSPRLGCSARRWTGWLPARQRARRRTGRSASRSRTCTGRTRRRSRSSTSCSQPPTTRGRGSLFSFTAAIPSTRPRHLVEQGATAAYRHRFRELELGPASTARGARARRDRGREPSCRLPFGDLIIRASRAVIHSSSRRPSATSSSAARCAVRTVGVYTRQPASTRSPSPGLVQEALQARLDRLSHETREVLGRRLRHRGPPSACLCSNGSWGREQLGSALADLQRLELVVEERRQPAPRVPIPSRPRAGGRLRQPRREPAAGAARAECGEALEEVHPRTHPEEVLRTARPATSARAGEPIARADYLLKAGDAARMVYGGRGGAGALPARARVPSTAWGGPRTRTRDALQGRAHASPGLRLRARTGSVRGCVLASGGAADPPGAERANRDLGSPSPAAELTPGHAYQKVDTELVDLLFRGLVKLGPNLNVVPDLAESFGVSRRRLHLSSS